MRGGREILAIVPENLTAVREIFAVDGSTGLDRRTFDRSTGEVFDRRTAETHLKMVNRGTIIGNYP